MDDLKKITVLIVTWKRDDLLKDCLDSIVRTTGGMPPATVVVDNGGEATTRKLCGGYPFVTYVATEQNLGFAGGNNVGLPFCKTDYIVLLNNDTILENQPFSEMIAYADEHPEVGVIGGKLWQGNDWPEGTLNSVGSFLSQWGVLNSPGFLVKDSPIFCHPEKVFSAGGALMLVKQSAILKAGGFLFYSHFKSYYEEVDFCHRVWLVGLEVHFIPTPKVRHLTSKTMGMLNHSEVMKQYYRNIFFSHSVNFSLYGRFRIAIPFLCLYLGSIFLRVLKGKFRETRQMIDVFCWLHRERDLIKQMRTNIQLIRTRSDREILRDIMKPISFKTFLKMVMAQ